MKRALIVEIQDNGLALNRVTALFHRRGVEFETFAIDRVSRVNTLRVTTILDDRCTDVDRLALYLRNLQPIYSVRNLELDEAHIRQLALLKVQDAADQQGKVVGLVRNHRAQVVDLTDGSLIVQFTGTESQISALASDLGQSALVTEMACSGAIALSR
ncbi:MAG: acetolactate synthase small subunit [Anaerolineales bacterium]